MPTNTSVASLSGPFHALNIRFSKADGLKFIRMVHVIRVRMCQGEHERPLCQRAQHGRKRPSLPCPVSDYQGAFLSLNEIKRLRVCIIDMIDAVATGSIRSPYFVTLIGSRSMENPPFYSVAFSYKIVREDGMKLWYDTVRDDM